MTFCVSETFQSVAGIHWAIDHRNRDKVSEFLICSRDAPPGALSVGMGMGHHESISEIHR